MTNGMTADDYASFTVDIHMPKDHICCAVCPILETYARNQCRRTGEYLLDIKNNVGRWCPLKEITNGET